MLTSDPASAVSGRNLARLPLARPASAGETPASFLALKHADRARKCTSRDERSNLMQLISLMSFIPKITNADFITYLCGKTA